MNATKRDARPAGNRTSAEGDGVVGIERAQSISQPAAHLQSASKVIKPFLASPPSAEAPAEPAHIEEPSPGAFWRERVCTLNEFLGRPPKSWLVDAVFGERDLVLLYGASGEGKTFLALDLALSCAAGTPWAGRHASARALTVVYTTGEGAGGLAGRLRSAMARQRAQGSSLEQLNERLFIIPSVPQLFDRAQVDGALSFIQSWQTLAAEGRVPEQVDLIVIDTLHVATIGADENSGLDFGKVLSTLRLLSERLGCACMLVHHASKNGVAERGHSSLRAACDTVLRSQARGSDFLLACEKLKDGDKWQALSFALTQSDDEGESVSVAWRGETSEKGAAQTREQRLLETLDACTGERFTAAQLASKIGDSSANSVHNALIALEKAGSVLSGRLEVVAADGKLRSLKHYWRESSITQTSAPE